jgi:hypothetical protein
MLRTMGLAAGALLLAACASDEEGVVACSPCGGPPSAATLMFSEVPTAPVVHADVCIEGGRCYRLRAIPHPEDTRARDCWTSVPPARIRSGLLCVAQTVGDGSWQVGISLPGHIEGKTVTLSSTTRGVPFAGQGVGVTPDDGDPSDTCYCPSGPAAVIHVA